MTEIRGRKFMIEINVMQISVGFFRKRQSVVELVLCVNQSGVELDI